MRRLAVVLTCVLLPLTVPLDAATADVTAPVALRQVVDVFVAQEAHRVLLSEGRDGDRIAATDLQGRPRGTVEGLGELGELGPSASGETALVGVHEPDGGVGTGAIVEIDPVTLEVTRTEVGVGCPTEVVETPGRYWYVDACDSRVRFRAIDQDTGESVLDLPRVDEIAATADGSAVWALTGGSSGLTLTKYDASTLEVLATSTRPDNLAYARDLLLTPDGTELVTSMSEATRTFDATTLAEVRHFPAALGVAVSPQGHLALLDGPIRVFLPGGHELMNTYPGEARAGVFGGGTLYVGQGYRPDVELRTLVPRYASQVKVKVRPSAEYRKGRAVLQLTAPSDDRRVDLFLDIRGKRGEVPLGWVNVPEDQRLRVRLPLEWNGRVVARYGGDGQVAPSSDRSDDVWVSGLIRNKAVDFVRRTGDVHEVRTSKSATIVGQVLPGQPGRRVTIYYSFKIDGTWQVSRWVTARLDEDSVTGLRFIGRPEYRGLMMRMAISQEPRTDTQGASGEFIYYRWIS